MTVSREDRRRHLESLIAELEDGRNLTMTFLDDNDRLLRRRDNALTVYVSDMFAFAVSDGVHARSDLIEFESQRLRDALASFHEKLAASESSGTRRDHEAIAFLRGVTKLV